MIFLFNRQKIRQVKKKENMTGDEKTKYDR